MHGVLQSVENQMLRETGYILINNGLTEQINDLVENYLKIATMPVMYIKKRNGGVHTALKKGVKIEFFDLRKVIGYYENGMLVQHMKDAYRDQKSGGNRKWDFKGHRSFIYNNTFSNSMVVSNMPEWNGKKISELKSCSLFLRPHGWEKDVMEREN